MFKINHFCFRTLLVSSDSLSSSQQLDCLNQWVASTTELTIAGVSAKVCLMLDIIVCKEQIFIEIQASETVLLLAVDSKAYNHLHSKKNCIVRR